MLYSCLWSVEDARLLSVHELRTVIGLPELLLESPEFCEGLVRIAEFLLAQLALWFLRRYPFPCRSVQMQSNVSVFVSNHFQR
jgi:hypothetical protein